MTGLGRDWRVVDGVPTAWFEARSLGEGVAFAGRAVALTDELAVDVRATGVRVRLDADAHAEAVSAIARELGLGADTAALQQLSVVVESPEPSAVRSFWQPVLGYEPGADGGLTDPVRRDPALRLRASSEVRPLRNRFHLDVVRPAAEVERAQPGEPYGAFGVCHADHDGNEVDLVPAGGLDDAPGTDDWHSVFSAIACYRTTSPAQQHDLAVAAAALADDAGFPLLIDLRPGLVVLDTGKDRWEADAHGLDLDFADLARRIQVAARELGAVADPALPHFVQVVLDAADVAGLRAFWSAALGYVPDRRDWVTEILDPRWLNPVLLFQEIDTSEVDRLRQRNRTQLELAVPADVADARVAAVVAAGGRVLDGSAGRWRIADPEGNELVVVSEA